MFNKNIKYLKILIAAFTFPPNKDGVSEAASVMAEGFQEQGWDVEIATEPIQPHRATPLWRGIPIHEFSITGSPYPQHPYKGQVQDFQDFLLSGSWDVIIFHAYLWPLYLSVPFLDRIKARKVLVSHGYTVLTWVPSSKLPFGFVSLFSALLQSLQMLLWVGKIDRWVFLDRRSDFRGFYDHLLAKISNHPGVRIIPNGVEPLQELGPRGQFRKEILSRSQTNKENSIIFVCVANYSQRKDQGFAARAFRRAAIPNSYLVFIESEFNEWSERFQQEDSPWEGNSHPGRILWLEKMERSETLDAISNSDVMILSSKVEAQPIVLLEAMREKIPWIARDSGCISGMPGGVTISNETAMADAMTKMAMDSLFREKLGRAGLDAVTRIYNRISYKKSYCSLVKELK